MATTLLTDGVPVSVVSGRLGHARAATTLNVYSHFVEAGDQAAADGIGSLLDGSEAVISTVISTVSFGDVVVLATFRAPMMGITNDGHVMGTETPDVERPHRLDGA